jgi:uncharacterized protein YaaR (DUF327 family)
MCEVFILQSSKTFGELPSETQKKLNEFLSHSNPDFVDALWKYRECAIRNRFVFEENTNIYRLIKSVKDKLNDFSKKLSAKRKTFIKDVAMVVVMFLLINSSLIGSGFLFRLTASHNIISAIKNLCSLETVEAAVLISAIIILINAFQVIISFRFLKTCRKEYVELKNVKNCISNANDFLELMNSVDLPQEQELKSQQQKQNRDDEALSPEPKPNDRDHGVSSSASSYSVDEI